jgi:hypothetical protein
MLSDLFVPMLDDFSETNDPVEEYLVGLGLLAAVTDGVEVVIPGHGSVGRGAEVVGRVERDRAYLRALRDGRDPGDPRIDGPEPGWECVGEIHASQTRQVAERRAGGATA